MNIGVLDLTFLIFKFLAALAIVGIVIFFIGGIIDEIASAIERHQERAYSRYLDSLRTPSYFKKVG